MIWFHISTSGVYSLNQETVTIFRKEVTSETDPLFLDAVQSDSSLEWDLHESTSALSYDVHNTAFYPLSYLDLEYEMGESNSHDQVYTYSNIFPISPQLPTTEPPTVTESEEDDTQQQNKNRVPNWFSRKVARFKQKPKEIKSRSVKDELKRKHR